MARYGGEEFAVLLHDPSHQYVQECADRIHANVAALAIAHEHSSVANVVTASIGVAYVKPTEGRHAAGLVQLADEALYDAKANGRNCSVFSETAYQTLQTGKFRGKRRAVAS